MFPTHQPLEEPKQQEILPVEGETPNRKIVFVGDSGVGKTSSILALRNSRVYEGSAPKVFQNATKMIQVSPGYDVNCFLCDTAGDDYESGNFDETLQEQHRRPEAYKHAHVVLILFSLVDRASYMNVKDKWLPEVQAHFPKERPLILIGTKKDLRNDPATLQRLSNMMDKPITEDEGMDLAAEIDAADYVEIGVLSGDFASLDDFERTVGAAAINVKETLVDKCVIM